MTFFQPPGSFSLCYVCFWEDDGSQYADPTFADGSNRISLVEAQANFQEFGACDARHVHQVRPPRACEPRDPDWRPATEADVAWLREQRFLVDWPGDPKDYPYYWRRKDASQASSRPG